MICSCVFLAIFFYIPEKDHLPLKLMTSRDSMIYKASRAFNCTNKGLTKFEGTDPFNENNYVCGLICRKDGKYGGSLYITHVNNEFCPQIIYGTPKLKYPYKDYKNFDIALPRCKNVYFSTKWNGMNVLIFKYSDKAGNIFYSAKSKGAAFLHNGNYGNFKDLLVGFLNWDPTTTSYKDIPLLEELKSEDIQAIGFELCGKREPHLVNYDFDLDLKPLFISTNNGQIRPIINEDGYGPMPYDVKDTAAEIKTFQKEDEEANETYRKKHNLKRKYEYNHFITEGRVLYCLDEDGFIVDRSMYKIKPRDIEEVHWGHFNEDAKGRVKEAYRKAIERSKPLNEKTMQEELDMGPKEWGKFSREVMKYVNELSKYN